MRNELAAFGGRPAVTTVPPTQWPSVSKEEILAVVGLLVNNTISIYDRSYPIDALEDSFAAYIGRRYAIAFNSGTAALFAAYYALGISAGDEVIVPSYTFWATVTPLIRLGAVPVFADIDAKTLTLSVDDVKKKITPKTRAVVVNHVWGNPAKLDDLTSLCRQFNVHLVEDASHAHGATFMDRKIGSFGTVSVFSLQANKPVAAGEGGLLLTDSQEIYERATLIGHFGPRATQTVHSPQYAPFAETGLGLKLRISALNAAIALEQLKTLDARNRVRRENMLALSERIKHLPGLTITVEYPGATHVYYGYKVIYDSGVLGVPSHELVRLLRAEGVQIKVSDSKPLHQEPLFNEQYDRTVLGWPFTEEWYRRMVDCRQLRLDVTETVAPKLLSIAPLQERADRVVEEYAVAFEKVWEWAMKLGGMDS